MQLYARDVFNGLVAEDGMEIEIPDADYLSIQTLSYLVATGTNELTVRVYESQDGVNWSAYATPIDRASVVTRQVNSAAGGVNLSTAGPRLRLDVYTGASCIAHVRVFVMGRAKKRNPAVRAARARAAAAARSAKQEEGCGGCGGSRGKTVLYAGSGTKPPAPAGTPINPGVHTGGDTDPTGLGCDTISFDSPDYGKIPVAPYWGGNIGMIEATIPVKPGFDTPWGFGCDWPDIVFEPPCVQVAGSMDCKPCLKCWASYQVGQQAKCFCDPLAFQVAGPNSCQYITGNNLVGEGFDLQANSSPCFGAGFWDSSPCGGYTPAASGCLQSFADCVRTDSFSNCAQTLDSCLNAIWELPR